VPARLGRARRELHADNLRVIGSLRADQLDDEVGTSPPPVRLETQSRPPVGQDLNPRGLPLPSDDLLRLEPH
jgi:hypothetical protein